VVIVDPQSGPVLTDEAVIPGPQDEVDVRILSINNSKHESQVTICRRGPIVMQPAYCFHTCCWWKLRSNNDSISRATPEYIFRLAWSTASFYLLSAESHTLKDAAMLCKGLGNLASEKGWIRPSAPLSNTNECDDLGLSSLLKMTWKRLPTEIMTTIWGYLEPCASRSLLFLQSGESSRLLDRIGRYPTTMEDFISGVGSVSAFSIQIKGSKYLCGFHDGVRLLGYPGEGGGSWIKIPSRITAIKFTIGLYGIQRVQIQGQSENSEWIGDATAGCADRSWTGIMKFLEGKSMVRLFWDVRVISLMALF
jgi:hypothetical protein